MASQNYEAINAFQSELQSSDNEFLLMASTTYESSVMVSDTLLFFFCIHSYYSRCEEDGIPKKKVSRTIWSSNVCGLIGLNSAYSYTLLMKIKKEPMKILVPWKLNH